MKFRIETSENPFGGGYVNVYVDGLHVHHKYHLQRWYMRLAAKWWNYKLQNGLYNPQKAWPKYEGEVK